MNVSDKIRHMALYADCGASLIVAELICAGIRAGCFLIDAWLTAEQLFQTSEALGLGFRLDTIYRGLTRRDLGAAIFFEKSERGLSTKERHLSEFSNNSSGPKQKGYRLRPLDYILSAIAHSVRLTAYRKHFPAGDGELIPDLGEVFLEGALLSIGKSESEVPACIEDWHTACGLQDEAELKEATRKARKDIQALEALPDDESTALPAGWNSVLMFKRIFRRAKHEAEPEERVSFTDHARLYGVSKTGATALLKGAGLKNDRESQIYDVPFDASRSLDEQIQEHQREARAHYYDERIDSDGVKVLCFRRASQQKVVGAVVVTKPPKAPDKDLSPVTNVTPATPRTRKAHRSLNLRWFEHKLEVAIMRANDYRASFVALSQPAKEDRETEIIHNVTPPKPLPRPDNLPDEGKWSAADRDEFLASMAAFDEVDA